MSLTRPPSLPPEDIERLLNRLQRIAERGNGASINVTDPRVTSVQTWLLTAIGVAIIGTGSWLINSVNELNRILTRVVTQNEYRDEDIKQIKEHVRSVDGRVVILEKRAP